MAGLAKSPTRENRTIIIKVKDRKQFIENANNCRPSKEFFEQCKKAGQLCGISE